MNTIRIATRESKLALWQAHFIRDQLLHRFADFQIEIVGMTTAGDRWLDKPLSEVGGKGLFIKELEAAILAGKADIAVHSMKDLPAHLPPGFSLEAIGYRADVHDVLVGVSHLDELESGAKVGSSSLRRKAQLLATRPDLDVQPIRGNVGTRLDKLMTGDFDAIVLAQAGLDRLALDVEASWQIPVEVSLPAAGQGALGVECLADSPVAALIAQLNDSSVSRCVMAERGVSAGLGADCSAPLAAYARYVEENDPATADAPILLAAKLGSPDGKTLIIAQAQGDDPEALAREVVDSLKEQGALEILADLNG
ncbi:MAG: hydroxymethylbilane synthase [Pseudomonadota bacterium]